MGHWEKKQTKPRASRRKGIIKIRVEINEIESINETEIQFFEKINKRLGRLTKKKERKDSNY